MRLWSLHPSYLDTKGLVAVWREGLLALHVLRGQTQGYTNHPQLLRFRTTAFPIISISEYLHGIGDEADIRGYNFNREKLLPRQEKLHLSVTQGQLEYEKHHLLSKLQTRDVTRFEQVKALATVTSHPVFQIVLGEVEQWERIQ